MRKESQSSIVGFSFFADVVDANIGRVVQKEISLQFETSAKKISLSQWAKVETTLANLHNRYKIHMGLINIDKIPAIKRTDDLYQANWTTEHLKEYACAIVDMLEAFVLPKDKEKLATLKSYDYELYADVSELQRFFVGIHNTYTESHQPAQRNFFEHKGRKFVVPYNGDKIQNSCMTWIEGSEALQAGQHLQKDEHGKMPKDAIKMNSLTIISALCREVATLNKSTGLFTTKPPPSDIEAWGLYMKEKMAFFQDLPSDVVIDVGFFLSVSMASSIQIASSRLLLKNINHLKGLMASLYRFAHQSTT